MSTPARTIKIGILPPLSKNLSASISHLALISGDGRGPDGGDRRPLDPLPLAADLGCDLGGREEAPPPARPPGQLRPLARGLTLQQADTQVRLPRLRQGKDL